MLTSATSVLERRVPVTAPHSTHPYEVGWASEAVLFVQVEGEHPPLRLQPEISPDGLAWTPLTAATEMAPDTALTALSLTVFGSWLRLTVTGANASEPAVLLVHLALKG